MHPFRGDSEAVRGSIEGYLGKSKEIFDANFLDLAEEKIGEIQEMKGFSFPTNEGMRKVTKTPELKKLEQDPSLRKLRSIIQDTIHSVGSKKTGGIYAGVNAFHHGHLAYLTKSEAIVSVDMNQLIPHGFAFMVGMVAGARNPEEFKQQVGIMAANPETLRDFFQNTELGSSVLVQSDHPDAARARKRLLEGLLTTMNEFDPMIHGQTKVPPVFCEDKDAYDYFRTLVVQDKVAGGTTKLQGKGMMNVLSKALEVFDPTLPEINTLYVSSCYDPRFLGPKEREQFFKRLKDEGHTNFQMIESFLNSGWIVYDVGETT